MKRWTDASLYEQLLYCHVPVRCISLLKTDKTSHEGCCLTASVELSSGSTHSLPFSLTPLEFKLTGGNFVKQCCVLMSAALFADSLAVLFSGAPTGPDSLNKALLHQDVTTLGHACVCQQIPTTVASNVKSGY